jgi:uncharacterized repeat protein (TIGR01451 family)
MVTMSAGMASAQVQFDPADDGTAYTVRSPNSPDDSPAQLYSIDQSTFPFTFTAIGGPAQLDVTPDDGIDNPIDIQLNNLGFRSTDGLLYALALNTMPITAGDDAGNYGLVKIDANGDIFPVAIPAPAPIPGLGSTTYRLPAGDITPDGNTMYINAQITSNATDANRRLYIVDLTASPVTAIPIDKTLPSGDSVVNVADWAVGPDGNLYGVDATTSGAALIYQLNPTTGVMTVVPGSGTAGSIVGARGGTFKGLPGGSTDPNFAYGGAWFNSAGRFFAYRNNGEIYEIDLDLDGSGGMGGTPLLISSQVGGPSSNYNDAAASLGDGGGAPLLNIEKTVTTSDGTCGVDDVESLEISVGDTVKYCYVVTNSADVGTLYDLSLIDDNGTPGDPGDDFTVTLTGLTNEDTDGLSDDLAAGAIATGEELVTIDSSGTIINTATASGADEGGLTRTDSDTADVTTVAPPVPALSLVKSLPSNADEDGSGNVTLGDTLTYSFVATNSGTSNLTNVSVSDPLPGLSTLNCTPLQPASLAPTEAISCTATYVVTAADAIAGAVNNTATADSNETAEVQDSANVPVFQVPIECTEQAFVIQEERAKLYRVDQSNPDFDFIEYAGPFGSASPFEINNLGFDAARGILWGWYRCSPLRPGGCPLPDQQVVTIDATGTLFPMGLGDLPSTERFFGGDVSPDGSVFYLNWNGGGKIYTVNLPDLSQSESWLQITEGGTTCTSDPGNPCGRVADWAAGKDGLLYGGNDKGPNGTGVGELAILNPVTGVRTDVPVADPDNLGPLPTGYGFGAAWFNASGNLFLFRNRGQNSDVGTIYEIADPTNGNRRIVSVQDGPSSRFNDGAACVAGPAIELIKTADPTSVFVGGEVTYTFTVNNLSTFDTVTINSLTDNLLGDLTDDSGAINTTNCSVPQVLDPFGGTTDSYTCSVTTNLTGLAGDVITNIATASGLSDDGVPVSDNDTADVTLVAPPVPALSLAKSLSANADEDGSGDVSEGDTLTYSFVATNSGTANLTNVSISDPLPGLSALSCTPSQPASLAPGARLECTATYVVTAADVIAGVINNTATAGSDQTDPVNDSETVSINTPALSLMKSLSANADEDGSGDVSLNDTLTYSFVATNSGTANLTNVSISDPLPGLSALSCTPAQPASLAPGATLECTATYVVTAADVTAGVINNTATALSDQTGPVEDSETVPVSAFEPTPFECVADPYIVFDDPSQLNQIDQDLLGSTFTFNILANPINGRQINNLGYRITDGLLYGWERNAADDGGQIVQIDSTGVVIGLGNPELPANQTNPDTGLLTVHNYNAGDVSVNGSQFFLSYSVANGNGDLLYVVDLPALTLDTVNITGDSGQVADWAAHPTNGLLYGGDHTHWQLAVLDPVSGARTDLDIGLPDEGSLGYGAAWFDAAGTLFLYHNSGKIYAVDDVETTPTLVDGYPLENLALSTSNNDGAACAAGPAIELIKTADPTSIFVGGEVTYTFTVNNLSLFDTVTIDTLTDNLLGDLTSDTGTINTTDCVVPQVLDPNDLAAGGSDSYTCSVTTNLTGSVGDVITNIATASGLSDDGVPVSDDDTADVILLEPPVPGLSLVKTASPTTYSAVGEVISYSYLVTNAGNVTISGPITVADDKSTDESCPAGDLAPGASTTCSATYSITQADLDTGSVTNLATASGSYNGNPVNSNQDDETVNAVVNRALTLVKTATPDTYDAVGDVISYSYLVTNSGNVTLYQPFTIDDDTSTDESCPAAPASLAPGESITCSASYTITQADLDAGSVTNVASATGKDAPEGGNDVTSPTDEETVTAVPNPSIDIEKSTNGQDADTAPGPEILVDGTVTWEYVVTNDGNVTLTNVTVTDDQGVSIDCGDGSNVIASLAPNASVTCTATGMAAAGQYENEGSASTTFNDEPVTDSDLSHYFGAEPSFTVAKSCYDSPVPQEGPAIFEVVFDNTGNVDISVSADEDLRDVDGNLLHAANASFELAEDATLTFYVYDDGTGDHPFSGLSTVSNTINATGSYTDDSGYPWTSDPQSDSASCDVGSRLNVSKTTNDQINPDYDWTFAIFAGAYYGTGSGFLSQEPLATDTTLNDPHGVLDFDNLNLDPNLAYTVCEIPANATAGWTSEWSINGQTVPAYNPHFFDQFQQNFGYHCVDFGFDTGYELTAGGTLVFDVDNGYPGGDPRTPGYWKNWSSCTGGSQYDHAVTNDPANEFWALDELLNNPGFTIGILTLTDGDCADAVSILDQRDIGSGKKYSSDSAYTLAMHLFAYELNQAAGACQSSEADAAAAAAQSLLISYEFDGTGGYLRPKGQTYNDYYYALELKDALDYYNNGLLCGADVTTDYPPSVSIDDPAEGDVIGDGGDVFVDSIEIMASTADDNGVTQVEFFIDGGSIGVDVDASDGGSAIWDLTGVADGDYTITATATDTIGQTASHSIVVTVDNETGASMHIGDLDAATASGKGGKWDATVTITVHDAAESSVADAMVSGTWSNGNAGSCTTDGNGQCTTSLSSINKNTDSVTLTVDNVSASGYDYAAGANHDPDGESNGTTIVISTP